MAFEGGLPQRTHRGNRTPVNDVKLDGGSLNGRHLLRAIRAKALVRGR